MNKNYNKTSVFFYHVFMFIIIVNIVVDAVVVVVVVFNIFFSMSLFFHTSQIPGPNWLILLAKGSSSDCF